MAELVYSCITIGVDLINETCIFLYIDLMNEWYTVWISLYIPAYLCTLFGYELLCLVSPQGEIRAFAFNEMADKFHSIFEMGKVCSNDMILLQYMYMYM